MSELRWHPLLGEWVATATHRQDRTFLPPADFCPLCPTKPGGFPTEIPEADYDIVVFENRFPSLSPNPPEPAIEGDDFYPVRPSFGECEVVVYTPNHSSTLAREPVEQIYKLVQVWTDRFRDLSALEFVKYVFIFENKGEAIGVTLHHPHGQIYAYPFIPPRIMRELEQSRAHSEEHGGCLHCDVLTQEHADGRRVLHKGEHFTAFVPFYARYPYEVHVYARRCVPSLTELTGAEKEDLARTLKRLLTGYDALFGFSLPYVMAMHQAPTDSGDYGSLAHFHVYFYTATRTAEKLKYLAGSEQGAGAFIGDALPETTAGWLRGAIERAQR